MSDITIEQLAAIVPHGVHLENIIGPLNTEMEVAEINTPLRQAAFIAQIATETGAFRWTTEIWGPSNAQLGYEPPHRKAIELGNTDVGDGFKYRGRGWIQVTGRNNFRAAGLALGIDLESDPGMAAFPTYAAKTATWYWNKHNLNELADEGDDSFELITRRINGGLNGQSERLAYYVRAKQVLFPQEVANADGA